MKKSVFAAASMVMLPFCCVFGAASFENVIIRQQWPWNTDVTIDFDLVSPIGERNDVYVQISAGDEKLDVLANSFSGEMDSLGCGQHRIVWSPVKAGFPGDFAVTQLKFTLSAKPAAPLYYVLDLSASNRTDAVYSLTAMDAPPSGGFNTDEYKKTKIAFRKVRAGSFMMGSPADEAGRIDNEDLHKVILTNDFYLAIFETSQYQFYLAGTNSPSEHQYGGIGKLSRYAVVNTSYDMLRGLESEGENWPVSSAVGPDSYIGHLRSRTKAGDALPQGYVFDLPTEAQWEYACRAGTTTAWNNGTDLVLYDTYGNETYGKGTSDEIYGQYSDANLDKLGWYISWGGKWMQGGVKSVCGNYEPNRWGFYDMHGNVAEMTLDGLEREGIENDKLGTATAVEPRGGTLNKIHRICRGGAWNLLPEKCRSASRSSLVKRDAYSSYSHIGFRLAIVKEVK